MNREQVNELTRLANQVYFRAGVFNRTYWMGHKAAKCPMDMWIYQELMFALKTDLVIETGTWMGGSALYFAHLLDMMGRGQVITVDIQPQPGRPKHDRIDYLEGSSTDDRIVERIGNKAAEFESVLVILDADHHADFKLEEMKRYAPMVTPESYLIAEDSCFDHFPTWPEFGPGPARAVNDFLQINQDFEVDRRQERHMITFCPRAYLKRKPARSA